MKIIDIVRIYTVLHIVEQSQTLFALVILKKSKGFDVQAEIKFINSSSIERMYSYTIENIALSRRSVLFAI